MREQKTETKYVISFVSLLQLAFIILKLCNVINWSWVLVMLPFIICGGIWFLLFIIFLIIIFLRSRY